MCHSENIWPVRSDFLSVAGEASRSDGIEVVFSLTGQITPRGFINTVLDTLYYHATAISALEQQKVEPNSEAH